MSGGLSAWRTFGRGFGCDKAAEMQVATAARKQKELAWSVFYSTPGVLRTSDGLTAQVECGNRYMRAKKEFDNQWIATSRGG